MRLLLIVTLLLAAGWSGYWYIGATVQKSAIETWIEDSATRTPRVTAGDLRVTGFPNRFDIVLEDLVVDALQDGIRWTTPGLRVYALSYQPNRVIATLPEQQRIEGPDLDLDIRSDRLAASLHVAPFPSLPLREAVAETEALSLDTPEGPLLALARARFALREAQGADAPENGYEIDLVADALTLPAPLRARVDPEGRLPEAIDGIRLRATPVLDRPLDRRLAEGAPPELTALSIANASLAWGGIAVSVSGDLIVDRLGRADGTLDLEAENWREMLALAEAAGVLTPDRARAARRGLALFARATGGGDTLRVPLSFSGGFARIGPVPIGRAPQLR